MSSLNVKQCVEYTVWCGKGSTPSRVKNNKKYYKKGTAQECLKIGFGAGHYEQQRQNLKSSDLKNIKYIGETYEKNFKKEGVRTISGLNRKVKNMSSEEKRTFLKRVFKMKDGKLDKRAYNSTILFLHTNGMGNLPSCSPQKKPVL